MKNFKYGLFIICALLFFMGDVKAASCTYGNSKFYINCRTGSEGKANCTVGGTDKGDIYLDHWYVKPDNAIVEKCDVIYYYLAQDATQKRIKISGFYEKSNSVFDKNNMYGITKKSDSSGGNETQKPGDKNPVGVGSGDFDTDSPCTGNFKRVFTAIGWIFFMAKIVIPIILIIFGSIDIGKAVISAKDDEIKKSVKSLVIRIIAGIIIFFVPALLNVIVGLIGTDADGTYKGKFGACTSCMLDPTQSSCNINMEG